MSSSKTIIHSTGAGSSLIDLGFSPCHQLYSEQASLPDTVEWSRRKGIEGSLFISYSGVDFEKNQKHRKTFAREGRGETLEGRLRIGITAGFSPNLAWRMKEDEWALLEKRAGYESVYAIGMTGLDLSKNAGKDLPIPGDQADALRRHLEISLKVNKPVILLSKDANPQLAKFLRDFLAEKRISSLNGFIYSFYGDVKEMKEFISLGLYIGFNSWVCNTENKDLRDAAAEIPIDRIVLTSNCPAIRPFWSKWSNPSDIISVVNSIANLKGMNSFEEKDDLKDIILQNTLALVPTFK